MKRIASAVCLTLALVCAGCQPSDEPVRKPEPPSTGKPSLQPKTDERVDHPEPEVKPKYSPEQIAAARELASQLGARITEDADGNVTGIDMAAGRSWAGDAQMQEILIFENLRSLTLEGPSITGALVPCIAGLERLTSLRLSNTLIDDSGIAQLTSLRSLRIIDLRAATQVHDASMESLAKMPELRAVRLVGGNVTDAGIATLLKLPRLSELDIRNCRKVTKKGIEMAAAKKSLRVLKIGGSTIDDEVLRVVAGMDHLTGLSLDNCSITDAGVSRLAGVPLVDLTIYQCANVTDKGLEVLSHYDDLRRLTLADVGAKGSALAGLPHPGKLTSLNMSQSRITDAEVAHLAKLKNLASLNLSQTEITDAAIDTLSKMTALRQVALSQTALSEEGIDRLRKALPDCTIQ